MRAAYLQAAEREADKRGRPAEIDVDRVERCVARLKPAERTAHERRHALGEFGGLLGEFRRGRPRLAERRRVAEWRAALWG